MSLDPDVKALFQAKNFGTVSVHLPSGAVSTQVMWVDADDDHVVFNTEVHRAKYKAVQADPRVTVTVWDADNPYHYAEVRGRVISTETGPAAKDHIDALAKKYMGSDSYPNPIQSERVIVRVEPDRQRVNGR
jgi:PPOX class probable F420-dependent enzyme